MATKKKRKISNRLLRKMAARKEAMPHVKRLCQKYGRATIAGCVARIRAQERVRQDIAEMERELSDLKRKK